jgi:hypothetical protein
MSLFRANTPTAGFTPPAFLLWISGRSTTGVFPPHENSSDFHHIDNFDTLYLFRIVWDSPWPHPPAASNAAENHRKMLDMHWKYHFRLSRGKRSLDTGGPTRRHGTPPTLRSKSFPAFFFPTHYTLNCFKSLFRCSPHNYTPILHPHTADRV